MQYATIFISALALLLSGFTFYWTSIRKKKSFYLVRLDRASAPFDPEFAIINGGSEDILVVSVECGFEDSTESACVYPAQRVENLEESSFLIPAGRAHHYKVTFLEGFTASFARAGKRKEGPNGLLYERTLRVNVTWVELDANLHSARVKFAAYGFSEDGGIRSRKRTMVKQDLYKLSRVT